MIVWRLETLCGKGFYFSKESDGASFQDYVRHPVPSDDRIRGRDDYLSYKVIKDHKFGFPSIKTARAWFHSRGILKRLKDVKLVAYDSYTRLHIAKHQCVFIPVEGCKRAVFKASDLHDLSVRQLYALARQQLTETNEQDNP